MALSRAQTLSTLTSPAYINGSPVTATLTPDGNLTWRGAAADGDRSLSIESEVLGFQTEDDDERAIRIRAFVDGGSSGGGKKRVMKDYVLEMPTVDSGIEWSERLTDCINSCGRPKRLFIILNPFGGKKCARKIFHTEIRPLLVAANILYTLQETKYQLHAQDIVYKLDLMKYEGIICVSGDGILVEVVNGLLQREDWDTAIKVPLGIIPAGTGNGVAKSLLHAAGEPYSVSNSTFSIIRGYKRSLDVTTVLQGDTKFFSVMMLTWGFVADVDIESEKYRWMGIARIDFYSCLRVMNLRRYHGRVQFVPAPGYEVYGELIQSNGDCTIDTGISKQHGEGDATQVLLSGYQGPPPCLDTLEWRSIDGPFIMVWLNNVPWAGENIMPAPEAKFSDGYLDVIIIRECPKPALVSLLLKMNKGGHVKSPYVMYLKVKAFRLEPGQRVNNPRKGGIIDVDGEVIARGAGTYDCHLQDDLMAYGPPIHMTVDRGLATIFSPR